MFVKVHKPLKQTGGNNKGSSSNLMDYLDKENKGKEQSELSNFFNEEKEDISRKEAQELIDSNNKRLGENDTKFYMLTLNPSQREIKHLENMVSGNQQFNYGNPKHVEGLENSLKDYTKEAMKLYADNFEREDANGNPIKLSSNEIRYVAKIEHSRNWKYNDKALQHNRDINTQLKPLKRELETAEKQIDKDLFSLKISKLEKELFKQDANGNIGKDVDGEVIKTDLAKIGRNAHIHIVASRQTTSLWYKGTRIVDGEGNIHPDYDKDSKAFKNARPMKLSPDANAKNKSDKQQLNGRKVNNGFNHERFKKNCIEKFEKKYKFKANEKESYNSKVNNVSTNQINKVKGKVSSKVQQELFGEANKDVQTTKKAINTIAQITKPKQLVVGKLKALARELGVPKSKDITKGI